MQSQEREQAPLSQGFPAIETPSLLRRSLPWAVLALGLLLTAAAWRFASRWSDAEAQRALEDRAAIVAGITERRTGRWAEVLHGMRALFAASESVTAREFRDYYEHLDLPRRYPGFLSLQFLVYVPDTQKAAFEASVRADRSVGAAGRPNFTIEPPGRRADYYVTRYVEPMAGNEAAFGFDAAHTPERREAFERARDRGEVTGSGPLRLVQGAASVGYVLREPLYRAGMPLNTPEQRRAALFGMAAVALRMDDFITTLVRQDLLEHLDFRLHDLGWLDQAASPPSQLNLLYDTTARRDGPVASSPRRTHAVDVALGGRLWRFEFRDRPGAGLGSNRHTPVLVLVFGALVSLLAFQLARVQTAARQRLESRVRERTAELALVNASLKTSEQRLELALAGADLGWWDWNIETGEMVWNPRWLSMRGYSVAEARPEAGWWKDLIHPEDREAVLEALEGHLSGRLPTYSAEYRALRKEGGWLWVLDRGRAVVRDIDGQALRMTGTNLDISERKQAEEARVAAQTAQRLAAAKDEFVARMSHELRTPLNAILGFSQLLERDAPDRLAPQQLERVRQIHRAGLHLMAMVTDLLDFAAVECGRVRIAREPVAVAAAVREALEMVQGQAERAQVELVDRVAASSAVVLADAVRLRQVLVNLMTNAIKYNRPGGRMTIEARTSGRQVGLGVADTGIGMRPEQVAKLFQPFERLGAQRSDVPGTGLGLALSHRLVEMMEGRIEVVSEIGLGSRFTLWLPAAGGAGPGVVPPAPASKATPEGTTETPCDAPLSVLYAEDEEVNIALVEGMLALRPSVQLRVARSGAEALETARRAPPDLMLIDMQLGDMHGIELRSRLATTPECMAVPCIGLSGDALPSQVAAARDAGFAEYLTKPVQLDELLAVVDRRARAKASACKTG
ncbi:CHASE domain-containing protein [Aquabacterium sp. A7-Y]|uniref:CHASE domain-containing protein n=1 Tax=Aquabacterium sp. A7-Y TaxID=1349605 RepID=UPI00223DE5C9|nr:CHASE domain-containing protein [Aquabacterium sp. A7-Y]MCW7539133.1 CHASE domain-containing protein [Aquabacterium sp. A7-Y]